MSRKKKLMYPYDEEMAEQNIDDDSALSYKGRCELLEEELEKSGEEIRQYQRDYDALLKQAKEFREAYDLAVKNHEIAVKNCHTLNEQLFDLKAVNEELLAQISTLNNTVTNLKAMLFDLMYGKES